MLYLKLPFDGRLTDFFMQKTIAYLLFPLLMAASIALTYYLMSLGLKDMLAFTLVSLLLLITVWILEQLFPHRLDWKPTDHQEWNDIGHSAVGTAIGAGMGEQLTYTAFGALGIWLASKAGHSFWPHQLPFYVQVILIYLLADLGRYLQHRLLHHYPFLWRFHALHHSIHRLNALKSSRSHIVERLFQPLFMFSLIYFLGAPKEVLFCYIMPNSFLGILDHSNLELRLGWLSYVINGPAEHRLHHSLDSREGNSNFGSALVIWDMLFGTYVNPRPHYSPKAVGIEHDPLPTDFWGQLVAPFKPTG